MYCVYVTTNLINGKKYIGVNKLTQRSKYYLGSGNLIKQAVKKYGTECFSKEIIQEFDSLIDAKNYEIFLISKRDAVNSPLYYNLHQGGIGGGKIGRIVSRESREKSSKKLKNRVVSKITRDKISNTLTGNVRSKEACERSSIGLKLYWSNLSTEDKKLITDKISKSHLGKVVSEKTGEKISKIKAKLNKDQVIELVRLYENEEKNYRELSLIFGISQSSIVDIIKRRSYKWVWN